MYERLIGLLLTYKIVFLGILITINFIPVVRGMLRKRTSVNMTGRLVIEAILLTFMFI